MIKGTNLSDWHLNKVPPAVGGEWLGATERPGNGPWTQGGRESGGGMQGQAWGEWTGNVDGAEEEAARV